MGEWFKFVCDDCGYEAEVSGGPADDPRENREGRPQGRHAPYARRGDAWRAASFPLTVGQLQEGGDPSFDGSSLRPLAGWARPVTREEMKGRHPGGWAAPSAWRKGRRSRSGDPRASNPPPAHIAPGSRQVQEGGRWVPHPRTRLTVPSGPTGRAVTAQGHPRAIFNRAVERGGVAV